MKLSSLDILLSQGEYMFLKIISGIITLISLLLSSSYSIAGIKKIEIVRAHSIVALDGQIEINEKLGRAWVSYYETAYFESDPQYPHSTKVLVPGFSYDKIAKQIVYQDEQDKVICAYVRPAKGLFRPLKIKETKKCYLKTESKNRVIDDGFEVRNVKEMVLYLNIVK